MSENSVKTENSFPVLELKSFESVVETSIQSMSHALEKEREHASENIASRIFKKIIGKSDYSSGEYVCEALLTLDKLVDNWKSTIVRELSIQQMIIPLPPVHWISDNFPGILIDSETFSFKFDKEPDMLSKKIKFKLVDEGKIVDYEINEDSPPIYLTNEERIEYLCNFSNFVNELGKDQKIWKYRDIIIYPIATFLIKNPQIGPWLSGSGVTAATTLGLHSSTLFLLNEYFNCKGDLMVDEVTALRLGVEGEEIVNSHLKMYDDEIINLSNIRLEVEGNSIENDNILLTPYGIFVLEVKNFGSTGSYSLKISKDGKWSKVFKNGTTESIEYNPTLQNERHTRYLQRYINKVLNRAPEDKDYIKVYGLVIIANNEINIDNDSEQPIFRVSEIYRQISKNNSIFNQEELLNIKEIIVKDNLPPKKFPGYDYLSEIKDNMDVLKAQLDSFNDASDWGMTVLLTYLDQLKIIIHSVSELESKFGYNLINNNEFLSQIDLKYLEHSCKALKKY